MENVDKSRQWRECEEGDDVEGDGPKSKHFKCVGLGEGDPREVEW